MKILLLDTETSGLDAEAVLLEIAVAVYDTQARAVITSFASILPGHAVTANPAEAINGITPAMLAAANDGLAAWTFVHLIARKCDYVVAYNAEYDRQALARFEAWKQAPYAMTRDIPWICAKERLRFPKQSTGRKLSYIACDHGIPTHGAHRAAADVAMLAALCALTPDLEEQIAEALKPRAPYVADVSYAHRDAAKTAGFSWDPNGRVWYREMTDAAAATLQSTGALSFRIRRGKFVEERVFHTGGESETRLQVVPDLTGDVLAPAK